MNSKFLKAMRDGLLVSLFMGVIGIAASLASSMLNLPLFWVILFMGIAANPIAFSISGFFQRKRRWKHLFKVGLVCWSLNLATSLAMIQGLDLGKYLTVAILSLLSTGVYVAIGGGLSYFLEALASEHRDNG